MEMMAKLYSYIGVCWNLLYRSAYTVLMHGYCGYHLIKFLKLDNLCEDVF